MVAAPEGKSKFAFVGIIGESGSGKSSLVRAGLLPALSRDASPGGPWRFGLARPGNNILDSICYALAAADVGREEQLREFINSSRGDTRALRSLMESANKPGSEGRFLLVLDQLEEVFTYTHDSGREFALETVLTACALPEAPLSIVATIRSDYYGM